MHPSITNHMHHCLLIPELVLSIVHFVADDRPAWHDSRYLRNPRDVARLARTCKALADPALDVLWRTQHSLAPLVMCLPPDVWQLTKRGKTIVSCVPCPCSVLHVNDHPFARVSCSFLRETPRPSTGLLYRNTRTASGPSLNPRHFLFLGSTMQPWLPSSRHRILARYFPLSVSSTTLSSRSPHR